MPLVRSLAGSSAFAGITADLEDAQLGDTTLCKDQIINALIHSAVIEELKRVVRISFDNAPSSELLHSLAHERVCRDFTHGSGFSHIRRRLPGPTHLHNRKPPSSAADIRQRGCVRLAIVSVTGSTIRPCAETSSGWQNAGSTCCSGT